MPKHTIWDCLPQKTTRKQLECSWKMESTSYNLQRGEGCRLKNQGEPPIFDWNSVCVCVCVSLSLRCPTCRLNFPERFGFWSCLGPCILGLYSALGFHWIFSPISTLAAYRFDFFFFTSIPLIADCRISFWKIRVDGHGHVSSMRRSVVCMAM